MARAPEPQAALTLGAMLERVSSVLLGVLTSPSGTETAVRRVVILGPGDDGPVLGGDVVLAMSRDPEELGAAMASAASAGAAIVAAKLSAGDVAGLAARSQEAGVALAEVPHTADWGQVYTLLRTVVEEPSDGVGDNAPADLFALANTIAAATGGATTIEDAELRVVAYSNLDQPIDGVRRESILGRSVPRHLAGRRDIVDLYRRIAVDNSVVRLAAQAEQGVRARMGVAVRAGDEIIGSIWVVEGDRPFDDVGERALRASTPHAALLLLRHRSAADVARRRRGDGIRAALEGAGPALELGGGEHMRVVALGMGSDALVDQAAAVARQQRLADLAAFQLELLDPRAAVVDMGGAVLAIVAEPVGRPNPALREAIDEVVRRAGHALRCDVVAGIGGGAPTAADLAGSRWEAEQTMEVLAARLSDGAGSRRVGTIDDVRGEVVLRRVREVLRDDPRGRTPHLDVLAAYDAEHRTDHVATLGAYLDAFGDVAAASAALDVHPNTLRYRLKKIHSLIGTDLSDPNERFAVELQWRLR